jgi:hypothetical protein
MKNELAKFEYNGVAIAIEGKEKISLTDLWKASGNVETQHPKFWLGQDESNRFISTVANSLKVTRDYLLKVKRGKGGGTWAHWQIALAYAKYLSPELHMQVNEAFKKLSQEENNPELAITRGRERAMRKWKKEGRSDDWISARIRSIIATKEDNRILRQYGDNDKVFPMCANALNRAIVGSEAKQFREEHNLPVKAPLPDYMNDIQLAEYELSRLVSKRRIQDDRIYGNNACANVHEVVAGRIHNAVTMRGV